MKVKIGNRIFDSAEQPITVIFEDDDRCVLNGFIEVGANLTGYRGENIGNALKSVFSNMEDANQISLQIDQDTFKIPAPYPGD